MIKLLCKYAFMGFISDIHIFDYQHWVTFPTLKEGRYCDYGSMVWDWM